MEGNFDHALQKAESKIWELEVEYSNLGLALKRAEDKVREKEL